MDTLDYFFMSCLQHKQKRKKKLFEFMSHKNEASYFDQINMTKNWLEYDPQKFKLTNMNVGT